MSVDDSLNLPADAPFVVEPFQKGSEFLSVFRARSSNVDLIPWLERNRPFLNSVLLRSGAILLRGFPVTSSYDFNRVVEACSDEGPVEYRERMTPRTHVSGDVWTSTEYPSSQTIYFHNENSHCTSWPLKLFFCCLVPSETGGETPIADCRKVTASIPAAVRVELQRRKLTYVRNFHYGIGFSWQSVYGANTEQELDEYCRQNGMTAEWEGQRLRVRYVRSALVRHPKTAEAVWFNHGTFYHPTTLEPKMWKAMSARFAMEDFTYYSSFGDGEPLPAEMLEQLRGAYQSASVRFPWERGDVLVLDNMLCAHGRMPYGGAREVVVAMTERILRSDVDNV
jgi:Taurine catabolism dioxygenase TauD, TfdA family